MLENYKAYILNKGPMQPGVVLTKDDAQETPDLKEQKSFIHCTDTICGKIGSGMMRLLQHHNWYYSALQQAYCIAQHCIIEWDI